MLLTLIGHLIVLGGGFGTLVAADDEVPTQVSRVLQQGFESFPAGPFKRLTDDELGTWSTEKGTARIDPTHAKSGKQCLQLTGGENTQVILELGPNTPTQGELSFWAERWTSRRPFMFRIEKRSNGVWREIYRGDREVRVGRAFLSRVRVALGEGETEALRFRCSSPEQTGILIDDLRIAPLRPQMLEKVEVEPFTLPALVGNEASPLLKLKVTTVGQLKPLNVASIAGQLTVDSDVNDLRSVSLYYTAAESVFPKQLSKPLATHEASNDTLTWQCPDDGIQLSEGDNYFWIAAELSSKANVDHQLGLQFQRIVFGDGERRALDVKTPPQRIGVALRNGGDDGVHTYRIPGLATTNAGTLIAVYDVRRKSGGDLPGDIDVGMSRSTDGGRSWEPMRIVMDMGDDPEWRYDGIGDPAVLVDREQGTIWVASTWSHGNRSWHGSGPGLEPNETGQLMLVRSDDDGRTWSRPINITKQVKRPEWSFILQGPGKGITMRDGTLVFAAQYQDTPEKQRLPRSTIIYSRDHGATWQVGSGAFDDTTEAQVVEIEPGVLMLNCRYNRAALRVVMTTPDMGKSWQKHSTSVRALIEPRACMASLIDVGQEAGERRELVVVFKSR